MTEDHRSRRALLGSVSAAAAAGLAGCTGLLGDDDSTPAGDQTPTRSETPTATQTPTPSPTPTPTATATPDRPNIERQIVLRDKAAVTHLRRTVTGEISWPEYDTFNVVDGDLLGRWTQEGQSFEFLDDLTFRDVRSGDTRRGTYFTVQPRNYLEIEYENGDVFGYTYEVVSAGGTAALDVYDEQGEELVARYERTQAGEDGRTPVEVAEAVVVYEPDGADTVSRDLEASASGSGFVVSPDGYIVTNAHVVGEHTDPEETLYFRLARENRQEILQGLEGGDLTESERQGMADVLLEKLFEYYAEESSISGVSTDVGVLHGVAGPDEEFETRSWPATVEATGTVREDVDGEQVWSRDVAVIKVDEQEPLPTVRLGDATDLGSGESLFVIGYPDIGVEDSFEERTSTLEPTLTSGVVSARRTLRTGIETIQTDAGINNGNSGGPVYDSDGEVVGIATFKPADLDIEEVGFALPIETVTDFLDDLGVENEPGPLTTTYEEGLNALWRSDCDTVSEKMDAVQELWPDHPYASDIAENC